MAEMVDSQQQELSVEDIVAIAGMNTGSEYDTRTLMAALAAELNMPNTLFLRQGNTLFIIHKAAPRVGYFRALNADTARNFLENGREFIAACYKMGFDTMASEFTDPAVLSVFRYVSQNPPNPEMGYEARQEQDGGYYVTVKCGPKRGA